MTWHFFKNYLFSRHSTSLVKTIAWICILGVGVGVMAMVVVLSVMSGFGEGIADRLLAVEPHIVIEGQPKPEDLLVIGKRISAQNGEIHPFELQDIIIRTIDGFYGGGIAKGITMDSLKKMLQRVQKVGKDQSSQKFAQSEALEDFKWQRNEVIVGIDLARSLGIFEGDEIVLVAPETLLLPAGESPVYEKVKVARILTSNMPDIDSQFVFYDIEGQLKALSETASLEKGQEIRTQDPYDLNQLTQKIKAMGYKVKTWEERNSALFYSLKMEKRLMAIFLGLTLVIASFSLVTVLILLGTQKKQDIGILLAMGFSPQGIQKLFVGIGLLLSGIGIIGGLLIGIIVCLVLDAYPIIKLPEIYYDTRIPFRLEWTTIALVIVLGAIISWLSAWLPARINSRLTPVQALRFRT